mmetsp:Transcript_9359/g.25236  ORF Transcript_9359/g.25236 Transcript_9359/m.25236 type:complete len:447 (+) Transcript_9359:4403-5743(+)
MQQQRRRQRQQQRQQQQQTGKHHAELRPRTPAVKREDPDPKHQQKQQHHRQQHNLKREEEGQHSQGKQQPSPMLQQQQQKQQQQEQQQQQLHVLYEGSAQRTMSCPMPGPLTHSEFGGLEALMEEEEGSGQDDQFCYTCFEVNIKPVLLADGRRAMVVSIKDNTEQIQVQAALSELAEAQLALLAGIMPHHALQFLALESTSAVPTNAASLAREHKGCTIMFMDIVGFTSMCKVVPPQQVLLFLNNLFSMCDRLTDKHGVHKVETAGDCYIVSGGIMSNHPTNGFLCTKEEVGEPEDPQRWARQVLEFSKDLLYEAKKVCMPHTGEPVSVRIGIHSGEVVSGLIGTKLPKFSLFGDTMNTSARMESTGVPGRIHVSETTQGLLPEYAWESVGLIPVKGKGNMHTYLWDSNKSWSGLPCISADKTQTSHIFGAMLPLPPEIDCLKGK